MIIPSTKIRQALFVFALLAIGLPSSVFALTGGGATIHNVATLTFDGGSTAASVNVTVNTIASTPTISVNTTAQSVNSGQTATYTYTITNNANGTDSFSLNGASVDANTGTLLISSTPGINVNGSGGASSSLTLGGSITSQASDASGNIYIPAGSETSLAVSDLIVIGGTTYAIATIAPGSIASTTGLNTTAETPTTFTVTLPGGGAAGIGVNTIASGSQIGEQTTFTLDVTASTPSAVGTNGTHTVNVSGQTTAITQGAGGAVVTYTTSNASSNETVTTVLSPNVVLTKQVRNVTQSVVAFANAGVSAQPGDILEYKLTATPNAGTGNATTSVIVDEVPPFTTYVAGSTQLNGGAVADGAGSTLPLTTANGGLSVKSASGTAGVIVVGEDAIVLFQVTVD